MTWEPFDKRKAELYRLGRIPVGRISDRDLARYFKLLYVSKGEKAMTCEMSTMGAQGDTKVIWDSDNEAEVENAKRTFDDLRKKGFAAFKVKKNGEEGDQIREFDSEAEQLIMIPPMKGGA